MKQFEPKKYLYKEYSINHCFCGYEKPMYLILDNKDKHVHTSPTLNDAKRCINRNIQQIKSLQLGYVI